MRKATILLVEDNRADIILVQEILKLLNLDITLEVKMNGVEALDYLFQTNEHGFANKPDLILIDINIPLFNGFEVLSKIREDEYLRDIPALILTSSKYEEDVHLGYKLKANAVLFKPDNFPEFFTLMDSLITYWLRRRNKID